MTPRMAWFIVIPVEWFYRPRRQREKPMTTSNSAANPKRFPVAASFVIAYLVAFLVVVVFAIEFGIKAAALALGGCK